MFSLVGHRDRYEQLCALTRTHEEKGRSLLLCGPEGIGKKQLALVWVARILCNAVAEDAEGHLPCGQCAACIQIERRSTPDFLLIEPSKSSIPIAKIREAKAWAALTPFYGRRKILVIDDAHTLQKGASNALLKLVEEPPADLFIVLVTSLPQRLSDTLRSRCLYFHCNAPAWSDELRNFFKEKIPDCESHLVEEWYQLSSGNIGMLLSGDLNEWNEVRQLLARALFTPVTLASLGDDKDWLPVLVGKKGQAGFIFDLVAILLREAWVQGKFREAWLQQRASLLSEARRRYREVLNQELFWEDFFYSWCRG